MTSQFETYMGKPADQILDEKFEAPKPIEMVPVDRNDIETKAKILAAHDFNSTFFPDSDTQTTHKDFYVVIKVKVLSGWKALVSTDVISGQYWEITYNGAKNETYVDHYVKRQNTAITDEHYARLS